MTTDIEQIKQDCVFPEVDDCADVFAIVDGGPEDADAAKRTLCTGRFGTSYLEGYVIIDGVPATRSDGSTYRSSAIGVVEPTTRTLQHLSTVFSGSTLCLKAIHHPATGHTLIVADYTQIIGGHRLAYVRSETVPAATPIGEWGALRATQRRRAVRR